MPKVSSHRRGDYSSDYSSLTPAGRAAKEARQSRTEKESKRYQRHKYRDSSSNPDLDGGEKRLGAHQTKSLASTDLEAERRLRVRKTQSRPRSQDRDKQNRGINKEPKGYADRKNQKIPDSRFLAHNKRYDIDSSSRSGSSSPQRKPQQHKKKTLTSERRPDRRLK